MFDVYNYSKDELKQKLLDLGETSFRAEQLWDWLYVKQATNISQMTNLSVSTRSKLESQFIISRPEIAVRQQSVDGTIKWLLKLTDGSQIETVFIPEENRGTLCVSSQVGCTLTCSFCHTGTQRFVRNLTAGEIIQQLMVAKDELGNKITNIVMMGMGEPLYNYPEVSKALLNLLDHKGTALAKKRITLSTSGVVPMIDLCGQELGVHLAISLHAVHDDLRNILVPLNKKYNIAELIAACRRYPSSHHHKITFEYVMLDNINDHLEHAKELTKLIKGIPAKINLIPFNPWPGTSYLCSNRERIVSFAAIIREAGYQALIRTPRGQDILAACGQLKTASERMSKSILTKEVK
jgi:23S rRNA (adenine2503-C2)-methyltransferase